MRTYKELSLLGTINHHVVLLSLYPSFVMSSMVQHILVVAVFLRVPHQSQPTDRLSQQPISQGVAKSTTKAAQLGASSIGRAGISRSRDKLLVLLRNSYYRICDLANSMIKQLPAIPMKVHHKRLGRRIKCLSGTFRCSSCACSLKEDETRKDNVCATVQWALMHAAEPRCGRPLPKFARKLLCGNLVALHWRNMPCLPVMGAGHGNSGQAAAGAGLRPPCPCRQPPAPG